MSVPKSGNLKDIKHEIEDDLCIPPDDQVFIVAGYPLEDSMSVKDVLEAKQGHDLELNIINEMERGNHLRVSAENCILVFAVKDSFRTIPIAGEEIIKRDWQMQTFGIVKNTIGDKIGERVFEASIFKLPTYEEQINIKDGIVLGKNGKELKFKDVWRYDEKKNREAGLRHFLSFLGVVAGKGTKKVIGESQITVANQSSDIQHFSEGLVLGTVEENIQ